jgi:hypothetical protein
MNTRSNYIRQRLDQYEGMQRDMTISWDGNWPTFHFWQGSSDFSLTLPQVYCLIKNNKELCHEITMIIKKNNSQHDESSAPIPALRRPTKEATIAKTSIIKFEWDVPFKHKN